mgnify:FL=1
MDPANTSRTVAGCAAMRRAASKREKAKHFKYAYFSSLDARLSLRAEAVHCAGAGGSSRIEARATPWQVR